METYRYFLYYITDRRAADVTTELVGRLGAWPEWTIKVIGCTRPDRVSLVVSLDVTVGDGDADTLYRALTNYSCSLEGMPAAHCASWRVPKKRPQCPRCGDTKQTKRELQALSRKNNQTYVCTSCGSDEAMLDMRGLDVWESYPAVLP